MGAKQYATVDGKQMSRRLRSKIVYPPNGLLAKDKQQMIEYETVEYDGKP